MLLLPFDGFPYWGCCTNLRQVQTIKEKNYRDFRFLMHDNYNGEEIPFCIDPDKRELFMDRSVPKNIPPTYAHSSIASPAAGRPVAPYTGPGRRSTLFMDVPAPHSQLLKKGVYFF